MPRAAVARAAICAALVSLGCPLAAQAGPYAPLDCAKASTAPEKAICGSYALGQDEARMATLYAISTALVAMGQRGTIGDDQRAWIKTRDACGADAACLSAAYQARIRTLSTVIDAVVARGPF